MSSNLPPGVTESMIPGNRPEDVAWDKFYDKLEDECMNLGLSVLEAELAWSIGIAAYKKMVEVNKRMLEERANEY